MECTSVITTHHLQVFAQHLAEDQLSQGRGGMRGMGLVVSCLRPLHAVKGLSQQLCMCLQELSPSSGWTLVT